MAHFLYRELAVNHPSNRGKYVTSKEAINFSFLKENRLREAWRGMYMFKSSNPKEGDASFGDFYLEMDMPHFATLKDMSLVVSDYLFTKYGLTTEYLNFFSTNRSIWISIPSKAFNCYGKANLHLIHKAMAEEIHSVLVSAGYSTGLDLSIYRWNGLMRTLGSYLPNSSRWVTKFNLSDLEEALSMEDLSKSKFDNGVGYEDIQPLPAAMEWFARAEQRVFKKKKEKAVKIANRHQGMENFMERGELPFHRNLHVYSMALYLKDKGLDVGEATEYLYGKFKDSYIRTKEAIQTIHSAFKGNKHFAPTAARSYLDERIFEEYITEKKSFLVPRSFISSLHKMKANYRSYKILFAVLYSYQIHKKPLMIDLTGHKYKKQELAYFEKLKKAGFISYAFKENVVTAELVYQSKEVFQSHIVVPNQFIESRVFKKMNREFIVLAELWRGSFKTSEEKFTYFFNMRLDTVRKNVGMQEKTINRLLTTLKRLKLVIKGFILPVACKEEQRELLCREVPSKAVKSTFSSVVFEDFANRVYPLDREPFSNPFSLIIKCNYST